MATDDTHNFDAASTFDGQVRDDDHQLTVYAADGKVDGSSLDG